MYTLTPALLAHGLTAICALGMVMTDFCSGDAACTSLGKALYTCSKAGSSKQLHFHQGITYVGMVQ